MWLVDTAEWACVCVAVTFKMTERVEQRICIKFCIKLEHSSIETIRWFRRPQLWDWWLAALSRQCASSCILSHAEFLAKHQITQVTQPPYSPHLVPWHFCLFRKLKSHLKRKRFLTIDEIQENMTGQLMVIGRTVWGPKVPTLKGTEASLSCVQCSLYLVSSSVNVSIFHSTWLDTFWTDLIYN